MVGRLVERRLLRIHQVEEGRESWNGARCLIGMAETVRRAENERVLFGDLGIAARVFLTEALKARDGLAGCPRLLRAVDVVASATVGLEAEVERGDVGRDQVRLVECVVDPETLPKARCKARVWFGGSEPVTLA